MYKTLIFAGFERGHGRQSFPFFFFFERLILILELVIFVKGKQKIF